MAVHFSKLSYGLNHGLRLGSLVIRLMLSGLSGWAGRARQGFFYFICISVDRNCFVARHCRSVLFAYKII